LPKTMVQGRQIATHLRGCRATHSSVNVSSEQEMGARAREQKMNPARRRDR
jgi:hypothetical protein